MERGDQIVNNLSAISGLMRHEGRFAFSAELQEAIRYIRELEKKLNEYDSTLPANGNEEED